MRRTLTYGLAGLTAFTTLALAPAGPAAAADTPVTRLTFSGDGQVARGESYAYTSTTEGTSLKVALLESGQQIRAIVYGRSEVPHNQVSTDPNAQDWFTLTLAAPMGKQLAVGTYDGAVSGSDEQHPGLELDGNGIACTTQGGTFTVHELAQAEGVITKLDVTFAQPCAGDTGVSSGRLLVGVADMPPLPTVTAPAAVDTTATLARWIPTRSLLKIKVPQLRAVAGGTVTCTDGRFKYYAIIRQGGMLSRAWGDSRGSGDCAGAPQRWTAAPVSDTRFPFKAGEAVVDFQVAVPVSAYYFPAGLYFTAQSQPVTIGDAAPKAAAAPDGTRPSGTQAEAGEARQGQPLGLASGSTFGRLALRRMV